MRPTAAAAATTTPPTTPARPTTTTTTMPPPVREDDVRFEVDEDEGGIRALDVDAAILEAAAEDGFMWKIEGDDDDDDDLVV